MIEAALSGSLLRRSVLQAACELFRMMVGCVELSGIWASIEIARAMAGISACVGVCESGIENQRRVHVGPRLSYR